MRHGRKFNHLGRTSAHRKALMSNMATSLILHKRIKTTLAKAKELQTYVEPLLTKSKNDSTHSRRTVFSYLRDKVAVSILFREISTKIANRPGGYTRILKLGNRIGDNAEMCYIELVDYNENLLKSTTSKKTKTTRRGGRGAAKVKSKTSSDIVSQAPAENIEENTNELPPTVNNTEISEETTDKE
jgi:large subunit ribosomal protein L17